MPLDKIADKVAALGVPGLILIAVIATTGLAGGAAIVAALATLGGPLGMLGGIGVLLILGLIAKGLTEYGFKAMIQATVKRLEEQGKSKTEIVSEIKSFRFISESLKQKLIGSLYADDTPPG